MKIISPRRLATVLLPGLLMSQAALAVNVNITGKVIASPCTVETADTLSVVLPDVDMATLATAKSSSPEKSFDLTLKECPASTTKVIATYTGAVSAIATDSFNNTGTATKVALWLKNGTTTIEPNTTRTATVDSATKKATFTQTVQIYSLGSAQAGTVIGNIVVGFTYQ